MSSRVYVSFAYVYMSYVCTHCPVSRVRSGIGDGVRVKNFKGSV